jgi:hypothetical protein
MDLNAKTSARPRLECRWRPLTKSRDGREWYIPIQTALSAQNSASAFQQLPVRHKQQKAPCRWGRGQRV